MEIVIAIVVAVVSIAIGFVAGFVIRKHVAEKAIGSAESEAGRIIEDAKKQAEEKKKGKQLDEKGIAALPAAQLINAHEKLKELFV